jgi:type I restriction enzyme S subunit
MGSEWRQATLGDLCTFLAGSAFAKKYQGGTKGDYPFIKVSDMKLAGNERFINDANNWISESTREKIGAKLHPKNSIAFAKIGVALTYNRRRVLTLSTILDNNMMSAIPNTDVVHSLYFYYLLTTIDFNEVVCGTSLPYLRVDDLKKIEILLPPISEQLAIAYILGSLDDKIELNRKMNQTLEAIARAIFKSWFIDFDPVIDNALRAGNPIPDSMAERAEMRRQILDQNQPSSSSQRAKGRNYQGGFDFSGLSEISIDEIYGLFPDSFQDSELGAIPKGWEIGAIGNIGNQSRNGVEPEDIKSSEYYIALEHMPKRSISLWNWENSENITSRKFRFRKGNILFGKLRPYFHKVGIPAIDGVCSTDVAVIVPKEKQYYGLLLGHLSSDVFVAYTNAASTGTKMPRTNWKYMSHYPIAIPDHKISNLFTKYMEDIVQKLNSNIFESNTLASLRNTLLPKLISGELCIPYADKFLKEAGV